MQYTLAPMEGVTGSLFRRVHAACFGPADKYLTPFLSPTQHPRFTARELREVLPEENPGLNTVPQLLTNDADCFIWAAKALEDMGYREVNLNLGCPSGTVVSKGKGSGFLAYPDRLEAFLDKIFSQLTISVSVKTRLGKTDPAEFDRLLSLFNRYPICELTIHPRVQADFYNGAPRREDFAKAMANSRAPVCYNGDIFSTADLNAFTAAFPQVERVMAGRGAVADPALLRRFRGGPPASKEELRRFHDLLYDGYREIMPGTVPVLARMKELWSYMLYCFTAPEQYLRSLRKARRLDEYEVVVARLFQEQEAVPGGRFHPSLL